MTFQDISILIKKIIVGIILVLIPTLTFYAGIKLITKALTATYLDNNTRHDIQFTVNDLKNY